MSGKLETEEALLPNYFPLILPQCKEQAKVFFEEFEKDPTNPQSYKKLQTKYEDCMKANGIEKKLKLVRVPQQFQIRNPEVSAPPQEDK